MTVVFLTRLNPKGDKNMRANRKPKPEPVILPPALCEDCKLILAMRDWVVCSPCLDKRIAIHDALHPYNLDGSHLV